MEKIDYSKLVVLVGPTAVGKGTIVNELINRHPNSVWVSISFTTRLPRIGEIDGVTYNFITKKEFEKQIFKKNMLEWACVHKTDYYGTEKSPVIEQLKKDKIVILEIDLQGARQVKKEIPDCTRIFIAPKSFSVLSKRLKKRHTETLEEVKRRLDTAKVEMKAMEKGEFDHIIINDSLEKAIQDLEKLLNL